VIIEKDELRKETISSKADWPQNGVFPCQNSLKIIQNVGKIAEKAV